jgi:hypothetical protein
MLQHLLRLPGERHALTDAHASPYSGRGPRSPTGAQLFCKGEVDEAEHRPARPDFSSGPCAKRPGWTPEALKDAAVGRSHRSKLGKKKIVEAVDRTRALLGIPADYRIAIVPASDTGAVEMALWSLLGARPVDMLTWESFGEGWVTDVAKQLKLKDARVLKAATARSPTSKAVDWTHDVVFTWNGTTSGVKVPDGDWIADDRQGWRSATPPPRCSPWTCRGQARCRHLVVAEGDGRRGRARHAGAVAARHRSGWKPIRRRGRCPRSSA